MALCLAGYHLFLFCFFFVPFFSKRVAWEREI
jgi:hypothetical protein